jgi:hypothetical protein
VPHFTAQIHNLRVGSSESSGLRVTMAFWISFCFC